MLNNSYAPNYKKVLKTCVQILTDTNFNEDEVLDYLCEVASYDYSCPDKCDEWAMTFYEENEEDIMDLVPQYIKDLYL